MTTEPRPAPVRPGTGRGNPHVDLQVTHAPPTGTLSHRLHRVRVGTAEYPAGPTGCTVIEVEGGAWTAVDQRGGSVGMSGGFPFNHAICLAGGSTFGLAAAAGVMEALLDRRGHLVTFDTLPVVSGAVIYDFAPRDNAVHPDNHLGRSALTDAARHPGEVGWGPVGAGVGATVGKVDPDRAERSGQGAAVTGVGDLEVLVVTVVNAYGVLLGRDGTVLRGNLQPDGTRRPLHLQHRADLAATTGVATDAAVGNTTVTVVVTNAILDHRDRAQFARQVHSSMHRAIDPFHTALDGDVLFAVSLDEVPIGPAGPTALATLAGEAAWDAVIRAAT